MSGGYSFGSGVPTWNGIPMIASPFFTGKAFFVNPATGSDGNTGLSPQKALKTLYKAHALCTSGNNDVVYLIGNGGTTATARLSKANAQAVTSSATTGTLTWSKNACHLIGITAPTVNGRARIAPTTTETITTFGSGSMVVVSGSGCLFQNVSFFQGFATGGASEICLTVSGGRNSFVNCTIQGMGEADSAASTTGRSLLVTGSTGENTFANCNIGLDTVPRSTGASEIEFAAASPRNQFYNCVIETNSAAGADFWVKVGTGGLDRYVLFNNCTFTNPLNAGATTLTIGISAAASPGGTILLQNCLAYGATAIDTAGKTVQNLANAATAGTKTAAASA